MDDDDGTGDATGGRTDRGRTTATSATTERTRWEGRTDRGRTTRTGRTLGRTDGQRKDDEDGTDDYRLVTFCVLY